MADQMQPTPRSFISGLFSDVLGRTLNLPSLPRTGIPSLDLLYANRNSLFNMMGVGDVQKTAERISYGEPLTTGAGMTLRPREETINAAMTVIPLVGQGGRVANQAAMTAGRAGARYAERVIPQVMERGGLPAQLLGDMSRGSVSPLDVYHGTPHTLPPTERNPLGEFDASKIGTGEGAQAYGYGIYTAEAPAVANEYKKALSNPEVVLPDGTRITNPIAGSGEDVAKAWLEEAYLNKDKNPFETAIQKISKLRNSANSPTQFDEAVNVLKNWQNQGAKVDLGGNLYKVDLPDEKIATMLDWDKTLSQQSAQVKEAINNLPEFVAYAERIMGRPINTLNGGTIQKMMLGYQAELNKSSEGASALASEAFRKSGISGIKYLDEGSRRPGVTSMTQAQLDTRIDILKKDIDSGLGNQDRMKEILSALEQERASHSNLTRNFVVFPNEEKSMTILERNGIPASQIEAPTYSDPFGNTIGSSIR
jgi:hypothetical protein